MAMEQELRGAKKHHHPDAHGRGNHQDLPDVRAGEHESADDDGREDAHGDD